MKHIVKPHLIISIFFFVISLNVIGQVFISADNPYIDYFGRWDMSDPAHPQQSWSAVYLKVRFTGTSISIRMNNDKDNFNVYIDGEFERVFHGTQNSETDYVLKNNLSDSIHTLLLTKRNSTFDEQFSISGFVLDDGKEILPPAPRNIRKMEFYGDSWTAAMGNEALTNDVPWSERTPVTDTDDGFANIIARHFNAQYHLVCRAGIGLAVDWQSSYETVLYERLDRALMDEDEPKWDFANYIPDIVVICLGINDNAGFSAMSNPISEENSEYFRDRYHIYINALRNYYPGTQFVLVATEIQWMRDNVQLVVEEENDMGHDDVFYAQCDYFPGGYVAEDHPSVETHYKIANQIIEYMESYNIAARESFARATGETPVIDGIKDEFWDKYESYDLGNVDSLTLATNREDVFVSFKTAWDTANLYIMAEITDDSLITAQGNANDKLEIYFDLNNSKIQWDAGTASCDTCPVYDADDKMYTVLCNVTNPYFTNASVLSDTGWVIEAAIPWDSIAEFTPDPGNTIGFELCYRDNDKNGVENILTYSDYKGDAYKDASKFGNLILADSTDITFDGDLGNGEIWNSLTPFPLSNSLSDENHEDNDDYSAYFKSHITDTAVFFLIHINDDNIYSGATETTDNDYLKICFDLNNSKIIKSPRNSDWEETPDVFDDDDFQLIIFPGKDTLIGPEEIMKAMILKRTESAGEVVFELKVNTDTLAAYYSGFTNLYDNELGFDIIAFDNDNDDPDIFSWNSKTLHGNNDPVLWGTIKATDDGVITPVTDLIKPDRISGIVTNFTTDDNSEMTLTWNPSEDNLVSDDCWIIEEDLGIDTIIRYDTSFHVSGTVQGTKYRFIFRAKDYAGNYSRTLSKSVTVPVISNTRSMKTNEFTFNLYPNPVTNTLSISNYKNVKSVQIFNITGQMVNVPGEDNFSELDFEEVNPGIYIIKIIAVNGESFNYRVVKQ